MYFVTSDSLASPILLPLSCWFPQKASILLSAFISPIFHYPPSLPWSLFYTRAAASVTALLRCFLNSHPLPLMQCLHALSFATPLQLKGNAMQMTPSLPFCLLLPWAGVSSGWTCWGCLSPLMGWDWISPRVKCFLLTGSIKRRYPSRFLVY